ncbi:MAG: phosphopentomutase [Hyphomonadaceae bacterium]
MSAVRAFVGVLDSLGVGAAPDAARFGEEAANTLGSIARACAAGRADKAGLRAGPLRIPNLIALGLGEAARGRDPATPLAKPAALKGCFGWAAEKSRGKDTPSGHWEMMGLPVEYDWGYFPNTIPAFPQPLTDALIAEARLPGLLGCKHASGTDIIEELGAEHIRTGKPIVYTSADSVFQIAAHAEHFGLDRLYEVCLIARRLVNAYRVGRVIARPFVGEAPGQFTRTGDRHDYATPPHGPTLLDVAQAHGRETIGIGKISDIFAGQGVGESLKAHGNGAVFDRLLNTVRDAEDGALVLANFVDFDTLYGHRRDVAGYAAALEAFDARLPELRAALKPDDVVVLTGDHGCDPTWRGSDHTRECVPIVAFGPGIAPRSVGARDSFADIGQSLATHLQLPPLAAGVSFW